jgi:membrane associated rhomboid family serine protease
VIPIGDSTRARRFPVVNYTLIAANVAVFLYMMTLSQATPGTRVDAVREFREQTAGICYGFELPPTEINRFYCRWSFQPKEWFDTVRGHSETPQQNRAEVLLTILTGIFLHAGWLHIIGNMLFLWVFGDNVEDRLGHVRYLLFYAAAGIAAALTQGFIDTNAIVPNVGASGAVAGVLGAYLVYFPRATITTLIPITIVFVPFHIPAAVMIGIWFLQNLLSGFATLSDVGGPSSGVAFFAHIGGFVFGAVVVFVLFRNAGRYRPRVGSSGV